MTAMRADRRRNDEHILRTAAKLLSSDPGATMQAIADAAGLARPTVYRRYPDRDALITSLRSHVESEVCSAMDELPPWSVGPPAMDALIFALVGVAVRYPLALLRYSPVQALGPKARPAVDVRIADLLAQGQRAGVLRDDVPADTLNSALFGLLAAVLDGACAHSGLPNAAKLVRSLLQSGLTPTKGSP